MTLSSASMIDCGVLLLIALSILMGVLRGATREVLGIAGWAGAFATVFYGLPLCRPLGRQYIQNPMMADAVTAGLLFVLSLAVFIVISRMLSSCIKGGLLSGLDRSLGLVFGLVRGGVIVCLIYLSLGFFYPAGHIPPAVEEAHFTPWVALGAHKLKQLIPTEYMPQQAELEQLKEEISLEFPKPGIEETVKGLSTLKPTSPQKVKDLEMLIETHGASSRK